MTPEYKLRQEMYHKLNKPSDIIGSPEHKYVWKIGTDEELVQAIVDYFTIPVTLLEYPSKSYAVAVIYAKLLRQYFGVPVLESLKDPKLLHGNDLFYIPYGKTSAEIYDQVLFRPINWNLPQTIATVQYFKEEFYLIANPYFDNSNVINTGNK